MSEIEIQTRWSNEVDSTFIGHFIQVQREVFNNDYNLQYFKHKYIDNIYGKSVICVVYLNGKPVAARSLWRNDIDGKEAYQPVDTCVLSECRGHGVFSKMTKQSVAMIPENAIVYNFPNQNSFPGYIKLGWREVALYHMVLLTNKAYKKEHPTSIDDEYFAWWIKPNKGLFHIKRGATFYIVAPAGRKHCFLVIGSVAKDLALQLPKLSGFRVIFFKSKRLTFYNKKFAGSHTVTTNEALSYIPTWKIDAL